MDVFERVAAADEVAGNVRVRLGVEILDKADLLGPGLLHPAGDATGIDPHPSITTLATHRDQKIAFAAPDLKHVLAAYVVALD